MINPALFKILDPDPDNTMDPGPYKIMAPGFYLEFTVIKRQPNIQIKYFVQSET